MKRGYLKKIVHNAILLGLFIIPLSAAAQEMTREERIKVLEKLKMEDEKMEANTMEFASQNSSIEVEVLKLPPLSVFLEAVIENATVKRAQSQVEQVNNQY